MTEEQVFTSLAEAAAHTIIARLKASGMTEEEVGVWLTYNQETAWGWAMQLLEYSTTPEFKQAVLADITKRSPAMYTVKAEVNEEWIAQGSYYTIGDAVSHADKLDKVGVPVIVDRETFVNGKDYGMKAIATVYAPCYGLDYTANE